jgi:TRAP-type uncharacterized transport system fused permease subunit
MTTSNTSYTCDIPNEPEEEIKIELLPKIIKNLILYFILIIISYLNYIFIKNKYNNDNNLNNFILSNKIFNNYIILSITILFGHLCYIYYLIYLISKEKQNNIYILYWSLTLVSVIALIYFMYKTPNLNFKILILLNIAFIYIFLILKLNKNKNINEYEANVFLNNLFNNYELLIILNFLFYIFYTIFIII